MRFPIRFLAVLMLMICLPAAVMAEDTALVSRALPMDFTGGSPLDPDGFVSDYEYKDPTISVKIESDRYSGNDYWFADIHIGHPSQLRTVAADGFDSDMVLPAATMAERVNAVLAINGDFFCHNNMGYIIRQGVLFKDRLRAKRDLLLIDEDGDFHFMRQARKGTGVEEINGKKIINSFYFGPVIMADGELTQHYGVDEMALKERCQRMCIAQAGPLHYQVLCCGAPDDRSTGMTMREFAKLVRELGMDNAYNLDGGNSTMMIFRGQKVNVIDNPKVRSIADIIYFASAADVE